MKTNAEIRKEAWGIVRSKWFWRIFAVGGLLYFIMMGVAALIVASYTDMEIQTWTDFLQAKFEAFRSGLGYSVPSRRVFWQMTGASAFQQFISYVFGSILLFGMAGLMLKAVRNDEKSWFAGAFDGFKRPLELTWLMVLMNLRVCLWWLLLVVPGIVAIYRYRQAWYLKSEHPDWGAGKCLAESGAMMRGFKWRAFCLDLYLFFFWVFPSALVMIALGTGLVKGGSGSAALGFVSSLGGIVGFYLFVFALVYFFVARAVFYQAVSQGRDRV